MPKAKPIYVEILMRTDIDALWEATQNPDLHTQWDLRFSEIRYLPKASEDEPQRFLYKTNIGFGLSIAGEGESRGILEKESGERTSSLAFGTENPVSLIRNGSGYWRYVPTEQGIRFLTRYDYKTRFGQAGVWVDRLVFRPLMGWATAWSFDNLRLWLEKGIPPAISLRRGLTEMACTILLVVIWIYQGLFPKLLYPFTGEVEILRGSGLVTGHETAVLAGVGIGEILFGLLFLLLGRKGRRVMYILNIVALVILALGAVGSQPGVFVEPFNPFSLNLAMIGLSIVGLLSLKDLPSAGRCLRKPPKGGEQA